MINGLVFSPGFLKKISKFFNEAMIMGEREITFLKGVLFFFFCEGMNSKEVLNPGIWDANI